MYNLYDEEKSVIEQINYVKTLYESQKIKVKNEQYVEDLLLQDYVRTIRKNTSRYDYIINIFIDAQKELGEKLKKNRKNIETLQSFVRSDFLNNDKNFKLINIISCGYENYAWAIEFEGYGKTFRIDIPMMNNLNTKNIQWANFGKFAFVIKTSESCWSVVKSSYKISDIADAVKDYSAVTEIVNSLETNR